MMIIQTMDGIGPWGNCFEELVRFAEAPDAGVIEDRSRTELDPVPGFIESSFPPLVYHAIARQIEAGQIRSRERLAIVLGSAFGDTGTADKASRNLLAGTVHNPLLFYQSVPNSILGFAAREFGFTGTILTLSHGGNGLSALLDMSQSLLDCPDIDQVLAIGVELQSERADEMLAMLTSGGRNGLTTTRSCDQVVTVLLAKPGTEDTVRGGTGNCDEEVPIVAEIVSGEEGRAADAGLRVAKRAIGQPLSLDVPWRPLIGNQGLADLALAVQRVRQGNLAPPVTIYDYGFRGDRYAIRLSR